MGYFGKCFCSQDFIDRTREHIQTLVGLWGPEEPVTGRSEQDKVPSSDQKIKALWHLKGNRRCKAELG